MQILSGFNRRDDALLLLKELDGLLYDAAKVDSNSDSTRNSSLSICRNERRSCDVASMIVVLPVDIEQVRK